MRKQEKATQLGKLKPLHKFFLNPYPDQRYTRCPECLGKTKIRKNAILIHIDPEEVMVLNMSGPFCPNCDLLILHQDKLEHFLTLTYERRNPALLGNDYFVIGTLDKAYMRKNRGNTRMGPVFDNLHDFKQHVKYDPIHWYWGPADNEGKDA